MHTGVLSNHLEWKILTWETWTAPIHPWRSRQGLPRAGGAEKWGRGRGNKIWRNYTARTSPCHPPHHPPGLTLFQTEVHASFAPFSRLLNTLDAQTENNARHADKFSLVSFEQVLKDERRATINTLTLTIPDSHSNYRVRDCHAFSNLIVCIEKWEYLQSKPISNFIGMLSYRA